jgi:hypothetical protein
MKLKEIKKRLSKNIFQLAVVLIALISNYMFNLKIILWQQLIKQEL